MVNKNSIVLLVAALSLCHIATYAYGKSDSARRNAYKKTKERQEPLPKLNGKEIERRYPLNDDSQYASFGSDRTFVDWTHNDMGNR